MEIKGFFCVSVYASYSTPFSHVLFWQASDTPQGEKSQMRKAWVYLCVSQRLSEEILIFMAEP